jgi:hypothetical protein
MSDNFVETQYMSDANELSQRKGGKPIVVPISRDKCGIDDVDVEVLVMRRALMRMKNANQDPAIAVDIDVVSRSLDRMMRSLMRSMVTSDQIQTEARALLSASVSSFKGTLALARSYDRAAAANQPRRESDTDEGHGQEASLAGSPSRSKVLATSRSSALEDAEPKDPALDTSTVELAPMPPTPVRFQLPEEYAERQRMLAQRREEEERQKEEFEAQRREAEKGLWGTLLHVFGNANGDFKLLIDTKSLKENKPVVNEQAKLFGLATLSASLQTKTIPLVTIRGIPLPPNSPALREDTLLPKGIVRYLIERRLPVMATASSKWGGLEPDHIIDPTLKPFMTANAAGSCITVDFGGAVIRPSAYGFASIHNILPGYFPRSWRLLGSLDGVEWVLLKEHKADFSFAGRIPSCLWELDLSNVTPIKSDDDAEESTNAFGDDDGGEEGEGWRAPEGYRCLRVELTAPNSFGTYELQVSSFEVWGSLLIVEEMERPKLGRYPSDYFADRIAKTQFAQVAPPPDISTLIKKGGKGGKK